eukprot:TRINITY_DN5069_c0_g1_i1.p1 TRINITY_DN5069_c0_g1~~TRINITY_DN5069_c0_g1_i1.p1  ORF type:complete len:141 (+),score=28.68 TRINITY_DN5069_c0_g1_i1:46-468(+)
MFDCELFVFEFRFFWFIEINNNTRSQGVSPENQLYAAPKQLKGCPPFLFFCFFLLSLLSAFFFSFSCNRVSKSSSISLKKSAQETSSSSSPPSFCGFGSFASTIPVSVLLASFCSESLVSVLVGSVLSALSSIFLIEFNF